MHKESSVSYLVSLRQILFEARFALQIISLTPENYEEKISQDALFEYAVLRWVSVFIGGKDEYTIRNFLSIYKDEVENNYSSSLEALLLRESKRNKFLQARLKFNRTNNIAHKIPGRLKFSSSHIQWLKMKKTEPGSNFKVPDDRKAKFFLNEVPVKRMIKTLELFEKKIDDYLSRVNFDEK